MPRKAKAKAASPDAGEAADTAEAQDSDTPDAAEAGAGGLGPIMPLVRVDGEWWIDASELCEDEPIWDRTARRPRPTKIVGPHLSGASESSGGP